jgi:hypothetical protein
MLDRDSAFADARQGLVDKFCVLFPLVLVVIAYVFFDSDDNMGEKKGMENGSLNGSLNLARHSCDSFFCLFIPLYLTSLQIVLFLSILVSCTFFQ